MGRTGTRAARTRAEHALAAVAAAAFAAGTGMPPAATGGVAPAHALTEARLVSIGVGGVPTSVVGTPGAIWVAVGPSGIVRIDRRTNERVARIRPGGAVTKLAQGFGSLWALDVFGDRLLRIDPRTGRVTKAIPVDPLPSGLAIGHGLVWVESQLDSTVAGIDPHTGRVLKLALFARGELWPGGLAVGPHGVWVVTAAGNEVSLFDPATMTFRRRLRVAGARTLRVGGSGAWVGLAGKRFVLRIRDGRLAKVSTSLPPGGYGPVWTGHGPLWVGTTGAVSQIGRNGTIVRRLLLPHGQPVDCVAFAGDLWVADHRHRTILRIAVEGSVRSADA